MRRVNQTDVIAQQAFFLGAMMPILLVDFRWRRLRSRIDSYFTPSRSHQKLLPVKASQLDWIKANKDNIVYHAQWRANLYFLLLIAYYKQNRIIQIESTQQQYGCGIEPHIDACHSSLFPSLIDWNVSVKEISREKKCIFDDAFLWHWNSMTVACPGLVNEFDSFLEGRGSGSFYRKELLAALNLCSFGFCNPVAGMMMYFQVMQMAFEKRDCDLFLGKYHHKLIEPAALVVDLQKRGTFLNANRSTLHPNKRYLKSVLQWDGREHSLERAFIQTQAELLRGSEADGKKFIARFQ